MTLSIEGLPEEIILQILSYLAVPDLLQLTRASQRLRILACDPLLHQERLHRASYTLSVALSNRPLRSSISPPNAWIYLNRTNVLSRSISKSLIKIRLNHTLEHRPTAHELVVRAILPSVCTTYSSPISPVLIQSHQSVQRRKLIDGLGRKLERRPSLTSLVSLNILPEECAKRSVSPALVATRRQVIKEGLKDGLRAWVEGRGIQAQKRKADELDAVEKSSVKTLVRRFTIRRIEEENAPPLHGRIVDASHQKKRARAKWGREVERCDSRDLGHFDGSSGACPQPTRAHVLGLKRFWEGVIRTAAA